MRIVAIAVLALAALPLRADVLNVPGDYATVADALSNAAAGDEIVLAPGGHSVWQKLYQPAAATGITIRSADPGDPAVVDATFMFISSGWLLDSINGITFAGLTMVDDRDWIGFAQGPLRDLTVRDCTVRAQPGLITPRPRLTITDGVLRLERVNFVRDTGNLVSLRSTNVIIDGCTWSERTEAQFTDFDTETIAIKNMDDTGISPFDPDFVDWNFHADTVIFENMIFADSQVTMPFNSFADYELYGCTFDNLATAGRTLIEPAGQRNVTAEDCTFSNMSPGVNDHIIRARNITLRRCEFRGNTSGLGTVHPTRTLTVEDCLFIDNDAQYGGALHISNGPVSIAGTSFIRNEAVGPFSQFSGGAIRIDAPSGSLIYGGVSITDSLFKENRANSGASIAYDNSWEFATGSRIVVERTRFHGNKASGAPIIEAPGLSAFPTDTFIDCEFVGNSGIVLARGESELFGCTFAENDGYVWERSSVADPLVNTVIAHDGAVTTGIPFSYIACVVPPGLSAPGAFDIDPQFLRMPSDGGDGWGDNAATPGVDESLNDDYGDLRLRPGSPAIDAGVDDYYTLGATDIAGVSRVHGAAVDIGAYEHEATVCVADTNGDGRLSPNDFNAWILAFNNQSPACDQNGDGDCRQNDFNAWILNFNAGC
ncbi:MAG: right-handed parallel beta-helix repeat-containing protein [Planctomycetota bacterium]